MRADVDPIEVDIVSLKPLQAGLHGLHHVLAVVARGVGVLADGGVGIFGGQHHAFTVALDELAQKQLAGAVGVNIGGVKEVAARVTEGVIHLLRFVLGCSPPPFVAEGHGAQGEIRDPQTGISK
jgi:hypothetical protein